MNLAIPSGLQNCPVCGGEEFRRRRVLWDELIEQWELASHEADYIDMQQGLACVACGNNLRSMTLAATICAAFAFPGTFRQLCAEESRFRQLDVLEVNGAGGLTPTLDLLPNHHLRRFPEVDLQELEDADESVDLIVHSDTLEHVPDSRRALAECRRVLRPGGHLCYTVPVVMARLTRVRAGLPPSYHGDSTSSAADWQVQREYGADFWLEPFAAGFRRVTLTSLIFPASVGLHALKS